jgi:hypothetical protein
LCPLTKRREIRSTNHSASAALAIAINCIDQSLKGKIVVQAATTHPISGGCFG